MPTVPYETGYRLARVVTDGCHTNRPSAGDARLHTATQCQLVVMFLVICFLYIIHDLTLKLVG